MRWIAADCWGAAAGAQESIEQRGVYLDVYGMPKATRPDKALDTHTFGGTPLTHRKRGWVQALASAAAARVADADARLHYASGGGEEGGAGFLANQSFRVQPWDDAEFMTCLRWRLRMDVVPEGRCQHQRVTGDGAGKPCGHILDPHGRHAVSCMVGGARDALHGACCEVLHRAHKDAGLQCRREVHIPELATDKLKEPRADLDAWGMPGQGHARLDFTAVAQWAARHSRAEPAPGAAAATAEKEKFTKYGSRGGVHVQGLAMELGGRCGPALEAYLRRLCDFARARGNAMGRAPKRWLRSWREELGVLLGRFLHAQVVGAIGLQSPQRVLLPLAVRGFRQARELHDEAPLVGDEVE